MKKHPLFSADMLQSISFRLESLEIPLYHHEKWDEQSILTASNGIPFLYLPGFFELPMNTTPYYQNALIAMPGPKKKLCSYLHLF
jgi:hypothetical protein